MQEMGRMRNHRPYIFEYNIYDKNKYFNDILSIFLEPFLDHSC